MHRHVHTTFRDHFSPFWLGLWVLCYALASWSLHFAGDVPWSTTPPLALRNTSSAQPTTQLCIVSSRQLVDAVDRRHGCKFLPWQHNATFSEVSEANFVVSFYFSSTCYTLCEITVQYFISRRRVKITRYLHAPTLPLLWLKITMHLVQSLERGAQGYFDLKLSEQPTQSFRVFVVLSQHALHPCNFP